MNRNVQISDLFAGNDKPVPEIGVTDITTHSANVAAGGMFIACKGYAHHGLEFLDMALQAKPAVVAWEPCEGVEEPSIPDHVLGLPVAGLAEQVGRIADRFFAEPSLQLRVAGVTGTNGKTTTAWLASKALSLLGRSTAYMGTLGYGIGDQLEATSLTTPGCIAVHRRLRELADAFGAELLQELDERLDVLTVAMADQPNAVQARVVAKLQAVGGEGMLLHISGDFGQAQLRSPLWGHFNAENLLVAIGVLLANGVTLNDSVGALEQCTAPPGRMQVLRPRTARPQVVVDFAHTPDALGKALRTVRSHSRGNVWLVFGCGGDRDQGKRADMGATAAKLADHIVITNDNPRSEDPDMIVSAIADGISKSADLRIELDRRVAIQTTIAAAAVNDVVLIAGKGNEDYQLIGDRAEAFSDIIVASQILGAPL
jgi:UDP-N-acetylmuramyl tripeptide synthase